MCYNAFIMKTDARSLSSEQQKLLRIKAVDMVFQHGMSRRRVAKVLGVSRAHVAKWCRAYEEGGYPALELGRRGRRPGEQAALKPWQCATIVNLITDRTPDQLKMPFVLWTRAAVRDLIHERFSIMLAIRTVGDYLKRWGLTPQKPVERAYERNPKAIAKWLEEEYPKIQRQAKQEGATILWGDETNVQNHANHGRSYSPAGETPVVQKRGKKLKINMISAVSNKGEVRFMTYTGKMNQKRFIDFLQRLCKSGKKILLIVDNLSVHHGKEVKRWLADNLEPVELFFLPSYSPDLNPDEYLNRDLKANVNAKSTPRTSVELKGNVISFMRRLQKTPARVIKYFQSRHIKYAAA